MEQPTTPEPIPPVPIRSHRPLWIGLGVIILIALGLIFILPRQKPTDPEETGPASFSSQNNPNGPYAHQIYSATSPDSLNWTQTGPLLFDHASVPGAVLFENQIFLYFVDASQDQDQLSVAVSSDNGLTFGPAQKVVIDGVNSYDAVDPSPEIVNGTLRLYYLGDFMSRKGPDQKFTIYSAASDDGIHFTTPTPSHVFDTVTTDPDVFPVGNGWRMLVSQGRSLRLLTSTDSLSFMPVAGFVWNQGGVSDTIVDYNDGVRLPPTYRTYYCGQGIQSATGVEQNELLPESGLRLQDPAKITCDPSVIRLPDKTYLMFYKTQAMPAGPPK